MNDDETLPPIPPSSGGGVGAAEADEIGRAHV